MKKVMTVGACALTLGLGLAGARAAEFDGFETYSDGTNMQTQPKWTVTGTTTAVVSDDTAAEGTNSLQLTPAGAANTTVWSTDQDYSGDVRASAFIKAPAYRGASNPKLYVRQDGATLVRLEFFYSGDGADSFNLTTSTNEYFASFDGVSRYQLTTDWTQYEIFWSESRDEVALKINGTLVEHYYDKSTATWIQQTFLPVAELDHLNNLRFDGTVASDSASPYMADSVSLGAGAVPEPASLALLAGGGLLLARRRR